jgi:hypothetical protein
MAYSTKGLPALILCATFVTPALGQEAIDAAAVATGTIQNDMTQIGEERMMMDMKVMYEGFEAQDPDNPLSGAKGTCVGAGLAEGSALDATGFCTLTDADGDMALVEYSADSFDQNGAMVGDWTIKGGTGKWETATGGGGFASLSDQEKGTVRNEITGELMMK